MSCRHLLLTPLVVISCRHFLLTSLVGLSMQHNLVQPSFCTPEILMLRVMQQNPKFSFHYPNTQSIASEDSHWGPWFVASNVLQVPLKTEKCQHQSRLPKVLIVSLLLWSQFVLSLWTSKRSSYWIQLTLRTVLPERAQSEHSAHYPKILFKWTCWAKSHLFWDRQFLVSLMAYLWVSCRACETAWWAREENWSGTSGR